MAQNKNTYWVEYQYTYECFDSLEHTWYDEWGFDSGRFCCLKKDVKREVRKAIKEELDGNCIYKNLQIQIDDCYITTDYEI